ncbi:MAG: hypothetical protein ACJ72Z_10040, partial [Pyrinomonadaceae bacterium]
MSAAASLSADIGSITMSMEPLPTGPLEFPAEMVFVPTFDEEVVQAVPAGRRELPDIAFEDEEADDEFEQSLSGMRLDENDADEDGADEPQTADASASLDIGPTLAITEPERTEVIEQPTSIVVEPEPAIELHQGVSNSNSSRTLRRLLRALAISIFGFASFAAGAAATMMFFELPPAVPNVIDLPVA